MCQNRIKHFRRRLVKCYLVFVHCEGLRNRDRKVGILTYTLISKLMTSYQVLILFDQSLFYAMAMCLDRFVFIRNKVQYDNETHMVS